MNIPRLDQLERRAHALLGEQAVVVVTFTDGSRRKMMLENVIPLLQDCNVVSVDGETPLGSGLLLDLIRGIITE